VAVYLQVIVQAGAKGFQDFFEEKHRTLRQGIERVRSSVPPNVVDHRYANSNWPYR
jgi:hypothetical protein